LPEPTAGEAGHALKGAIGQVSKYRVAAKVKAILFNHCGQGHFGMQA
jgi:predicted alternative tryptophan synthase beta-subunit